MMKSEEIVLNWFAENEVEMSAGKNKEILAC
jgi:hypothetical protein